MDEIRPGYVIVARVLGARGVHGELKVEAMAPESTLAPGRVVSITGRDYQIERSRRSGRFLHVKLTRVDTREEGQTLRGAYFEAPETDLEPLPEGQYYRFQLIGLAVRSLDGRELGRVADVLSTPENDVYVVTHPEGEVLLPAADDVIRDINLTEGVMTIEIIPGLLP